MQSASSLAENFRRWQNAWWHPPTRSKRKCSGTRLHAASTAGNRMPRVRRQNLPPALFQHLLDRILERKISADQLDLLAAWLDRQPDVPEGRWFKRFSGMIVCGEGELVKTFLVP